MIEKPTITRVLDQTIWEVIISSPEWGGTPIWTSVNQKVYLPVSRGIEINLNLMIEEAIYGKT